jgi:hypothetical protein
VYADDGREFIAFHWHPGRGRIALPHAHFKTLSEPLAMGKAHIPIIEELGVQPIRQDWERVLSRTERVLIEGRSWHGQPPVPGGPLESRGSLG